LIVKSRRASAADGKASMAFGGLDLAARQAEVVVEAIDAQLEYTEAAADGIGAAEAREERGQGFGGYAIHFDVEVLRLAPAQPVADAPADEQRAADATDRLQHRQKTWWNGGRGRE